MRTTDPDAIADLADLEDISPEAEKEEQPARTAIAENGKAASADSKDRGIRAREGELKKRLAEAISAGDKGAEAECRRALFDNTRWLAQLHAAKSRNGKPALQEALISLWEASKSYIPGAAMFRSYANTGCKHAARKAAAAARSPMRLKGQPKDKPSGLVPMCEAAYLVHDDRDSIHEEREEEAARLEALLGKLDERPRQVINLRHGLERKAAPLTLAEVGKQLGVSAERVRQIEGAAIKKMQGP